MGVAGAYEKSDFTINRFSYWELREFMKWSDFTINWFSQGVAGIYEKSNFRINKFSHRELREFMKKKVISQLTDFLIGSCENSQGICDKKLV